MRMPKALLVCVCLLGATQFVWGQAKAPESTKVPQIPGFYNPLTGTFTTQVSSNATPQQDAQAALTGTSIFFREDFQISISNYDQPSNYQAVCEVSIDSFSDANGPFYEYSVVPATATGGGWLCDVPVLTLWTLKTPATDTISASVSVYLYPPSSSTVTSISVPSAFRESSQSLQLTMPGNTQTVVNTISFQI